MKRLAAALVLVAFVPASADEISDCHQSVDLTRSIAACGALIAKDDGPDKLRAELRVRRAFAYLRQGAVDEAISDLLDATALDPKHAYGHELLGDAYADAGRYGDAVAAFSASLKLSGPTPRVLVARGIARKNGGDPTGAIRDYDTALALAPNDAKAWSNRGVARMRLKDYDGAIADIDKALEIEPDNPVAFYNRGFARYEAGALTGALLDFDTALTLRPNYAAAYNKRGHTHERLGDVTAAVVDWISAMRLYPPEWTQTVQTHLVDHGHYNGPVDGIESDALKEALIRCARDPEC